MIHTACYRGFYSTYEITNDGLFLMEMTINQVDSGWKPIQGIMPTSALKFVTERQRKLVGFVMA